MGPLLLLASTRGASFDYPMNRLRLLRLFLPQSIHEAAVSLYVAHSALF